MSLSVSMLLHSPYLRNVVMVKLPPAESPPNATRVGSTLYFAACSALVT